MKPIAYAICVVVLVSVMLLAGCGGLDTAPSLITDTASGANVASLDMTAVPASLTTNTAGFNGPLNLSISGKNSRIEGGVPTYSMSRGEAGVMSAWVMGPTPTGDPVWSVVGDGRVVLSNGDLRSLAGQYVIAEKGTAIIVVTWGSLKSRIRVIVGVKSWPFPCQARDSAGQRFLLNTHGDLPVVNGFPTLRLHIGESWDMSAKFFPLFNYAPTQIDWLVGANSCFTATPPVGSKTTIRRTVAGYAGKQYLIVHKYDLAIAIRVVPN